VKASNWEYLQPLVRSWDQPLGALLRDTTTYLVLFRCPGSIWMLEAGFDKPRSSSSNSGDQKPFTATQSQTQTQLTATTFYTDR
jgi:hypothetical protein